MPTSAMRLIHNPPGLPRSICSFRIQSLRPSSDHDRKSRDSCVVCCPSRKRASFQPGCHRRIVRSHLGPPRIIRSHRPKQPREDPARRSGQDRTPDAQEKATTFSVPRQFLNFLKQGPAAWRPLQRHFAGGKVLVAIDLWLITPRHPVYYRSTQL